MAFHPPFSFFLLVFLFMFICCYFSTLLSQRTCLPWVSVCVCFCVSEGETIWDTRQPPFPHTHVHMHTHFAQTLGLLSLSLCNMAQTQRQTGPLCLSPESQPHTHEMQERSEEREKKKGWRAKQGGGWGGNTIVALYACSAWRRDRVWEREKVRGIEREKKMRAGKHGRKAWASAKCKGGRPVVLDWVRGSGNGRREENCERKH